MLPIIFQIGGITLYSYGLFIAIGFLIAAYYVLKISSKTPVDSKPQITEDQLYNLMFACIIAGIAGARLTYVLLNIPEFKHDVFSIIRVWEGGLVYYGGFISAAAYVVIHTKIKKIPLARTADTFAPAILIGHFFGRIGCLMAGCCYGKITEHAPWAITFINQYSLAPLNVPLHPVQLYEALGNLILFFFLHRYNQKPHTAGTTFSLYLITYSAMRFALEFLRGDDRGGALLALSPSQTTSVILFTLGVTIFYILTKRSTKI